MSRTWLTLAMTGMLAPAGAQTAWRAGAAAVDITPVPATGQWIAGLGDPEDQRISEGAHDPIWCRALAISDGQTTVVFAAVDLIGLFYPDVRDIAERVTGVPPENVLLGATHVHSAPDTLGLWGPAEDRTGVDPAYLAFAKDQSAKAIQAAVDSLEPCSLAFGEGRTPPDCSINWNDPAVKDDAVNVLQARRPTGEVIGTLVNWACHPEVMWTESKQITSDFAHYLRDEVEGEQGGVCVFMNGPLGGMVSPVRPVDPALQHTWAECERIGRAVGAEVNRQVAGAEPAEPTPIAIATEQFAVPMGNPGFQLLKQVGVLNRGGDEPEGQLVTGVAAVRLGPAQFVTIPGEAFPAVGFLLRTMLTAERQFLLGLTLDELGYILPVEGVGLAKYRYEESMSAHPELATMLVERVAALLSVIDPDRAARP